MVQIYSALDSHPLLQTATELDSEKQHPTGPPRKLVGPRRAGVGRQAEQFTVTIPLQKALNSFHQAHLALGIILGDVLQVAAHENQAAGAALTPPTKDKPKTRIKNPE